MPALWVLPDEVVDRAGKPLADLQRSVGVCPKEAKGQSSPALLLKLVALGEEGEHSPLGSEEEAVVHTLGVVAHRLLLDLPGVLHKGERQLAVSVYEDLFPLSYRRSATSSRLLGGGGATTASRRCSCPSAKSAPKDAEEQEEKSIPETTRRRKSARRSPSFPSVRVLP